MSNLLTNGQKTLKEQMPQILDRATAKTWQKDAKRLQELVGTP